MSTGRYRLPARVMREQREHVRALLSAYRHADAHLTRGEALDAYDAWVTYSRKILPACCQAVRIEGGG